MHQKLLQFIQKTDYDSLPDDVKERAAICLADTVGVAIAGRTTELSGIIYSYVKKYMPGSTSKLWVDGTQVSAIGAAFAHGMTIDSLDIHDGFSLSKGHVGAGVIPVLCATLDLAERNVTGKEFLNALVIAYEIASRAAIALHSTAADYHTSGAWNCMGAVAGAARLLNFSNDMFLQALGTAEFYGPRSPMMRCIDYPTMVKDGSGWGAMTGISAVLMAKEGFIGAPAELLNYTNGQFNWDNLGEKWAIMDQYFKPHAVCRWAQPAVEAALNLKHRRAFKPEEIAAIKIITFHEGKRLHIKKPNTTEEAQYSLPFSVAAALYHERLTGKELSGEELTNPRVLKLSEIIEVEENDEFNRKFPAERFAVVKITLKNSTEYVSEPTAPKWEANDPPSVQDIRTKFYTLAPAYKDTCESLLTLPESPSVKKSFETLCE